jgi:hypothetical protein
MRKLLISMLLGMACIAAFGQRITHDFENVSLSDAIKYIQENTEEYNIIFIYNELEDFMVTASIQEEPVTDALEHVIGFYPVSMKVEEGNIFIECTHKTARHLTGKVLDEEGLPLAFADVVVFSAEEGKETGAGIMTGNGVTNESGIFVIPIEVSRNRVEVSFIGYKKQSRFTTGEDAGTFRMEVDAVALDGAVVREARPTYKLSKGGMSVDVQHTILSQMGTAEDVLGQLPRVRVSGSGDITVASKGTPLIYVNNRKVNDSNELKRLKSEQIKSIEVITNPGAEYDATVGAVIRIKTLRNADEGISIRNDANVYYRVDNNVGGSEQLNLSYRKGKLEVINDASWSRQTNGEDNNLEMEYAYKMVQKAKDEVTWDNLNENIAVDYAINDSSSIGARYNFSKRTKGDIHLDGSYDVYKDGESLGNVSQIWDADYLSGPNHQADAYYVGKIDKLGVDFNGSYMFTKNSEDALVKEASETLEDQTVTSSSIQRSSLYAAKLIFSYPIWKGSLSFGSEYSYTTSKGGYFNEENIISASEYETNESNIAGFGEYAAKLGRWSMSVGLRYEHVNSDYYSSGVRQDDASREYDDLFPALSISREFGKWSLQLSANRKTRRPYYNQLRNNLQYDNRYTYEGGNPKLKPQINTSVDFYAVRGWLTFSLGYSHHRNQIAFFTKPYDDEIALSTFENIRDVDFLYSSITASPELGIYKPMFEVDYYQQFLDGSQLGVTHDFNNPGFTFIVNNRFQFSKSFSCSLNLTAQTDYDDDSHHNKGYYSASAWVRKSFFDNRLAISLSARDIFRSEKERWDGYGAGGIRNRKDCYNYTQMVSLTVTYMFNYRSRKYKGTGAGNAEKQRL